MSTVRIDLLLGRAVRDAHGKRVGRIHEIRAEERDGGLEVVEYHIGPGAWFERLGMHALRLIGLGAREPRKVAWDRLDISDPEHPVLRD